MTRRRSIALTMVVGALVLSGCATAAPGPESTASDPAPMPTSEQPSPSPTSEAGVDPADPSSWIVSGDGIGPVQLGEDFDATLAELPDSWMNDDNCSWMAWWNSEDQSYLVNFLREAESDDASIVLASASAADPVEAGVGPRTEDGLGIGSTRDEVLAQHPDASEGEAPIGDGTWLSVSSGESTVFFEFYGGDQVNAVTVTTLDQPPYESCS